MQTRDLQGLRFTVGRSGADHHPCLARERRYRMGTSGGYPGDTPGSTLSLLGLRDPLTPERE